VTGPSATEGIAAAQDIEDLSSAIRNGSWADGGLAGLSTGLDALGTIANPVDALLTSGVSWLIEHVHVLRQALDMFAGDPGAIQACADHWRQHGQQVGETAIDLRNYVNNDTSGWTGQAGDAYRAQALDQHGGIQAGAAAANSVGDAVEASGQVVAAVRMLVRDLIAQCVAEILEHLPAWLATEGCSLGIGTPVVIADAVALIAKWV
jgi:uncharacterized protein YukE